MEQQTASKQDWYKKRLRNGFFILEKNQFPKLTDTSYDPTLFAIINSTYIIKNMDFYNIVEPLIEFDNEKNNFKIDPSKVEQVIEKLKADNILSGLSIFELNPKGTKHIEFLEQLGAEIAEHTKDNSIPIEGDNAIKLKNYLRYLGQKFDITFSNELMDEISGIKYEKHSAVFSGFEIYALFANITKKDGYSFHSNGSVISSLYETFFQFIGFKVIDYFRNFDGENKFTMIMKKINEKQINYDEFFYIYTELKKRWPTRYGN